ncbi:metallophosphoesterase family protein [Halothermothrix orenii]|uniref:metallophosphoesterase family protein n=1 Tax=Halothermothrix orenii TaxID=31909 RepID=UPI000302DB06|nr:exonuclease subunit SbcD [Halothermothrix orenii]
MRILHTADWHLGKHLEGWSRYEEQKEFVEEIIEIADDNKVDMVLICGDIFDTTNPPAEAEQLFFQAMDYLSKGGERVICLISGNHDSPNRLMAPGPLASRQGIFIMDEPRGDRYKLDDDRVLNRGQGYIELEINGEGVVLTALPYPSESRLNQVFSWTGDDRAVQESYSRRVGQIFSHLEQYYRENTINIAMSHLFVAGGQTTRSERPIQVGGSLTVLPEHLPEKSQYTALGHLHRYQIASSARRAYYSGSPLQYSLSEKDHKKCVNLVELHPGEEARIEQVELTTKKPIEVWEAEGVEEAIKMVEANKDRSVWAYLYINVDKTLLQSEIKKIKEIKKDILCINPITPEEKYEWETIKMPDEDLDIMELFKEYYRKTKKVEPDDDIIRMFSSIVNDTREKGEHDETAAS